jgi:hypothetical protein
LRDTAAIALLFFGVQAVGTGEAKEEAQAVDTKDNEQKERFNLRGVFSRGGGRKKETNNKETEIDTPIPRATVAATATTTLSSPPAKSEVPEKKASSRKDEKSTEHLEELVDEMELALKKMKVAKESAAEMVAKAELRAEDAERRAEKAARRDRDPKVRIGFALVVVAALRFLWTHRIIVTILP